MALSHRHIATILAWMAFSVTGFSQMLPVKSGRLWGIIDPAGKTIAPAKYDAIARLMDRQAVVVLEGKYGLIDSDGRMVIEPVYNFIDCLTRDVILTNLGGDCKSQNCEGGKWGIINLALDRTIPPTYQLLARFDTMGYARVNVGGKCGYENCDGGLWGIIDTTAQELLLPQYKAIQAGIGTEIYVQGDQGWGLYDLRSRTMVIPPKYQRLLRVSPIHIAMQADSLWGILDNKGQQLVKPAYQGFKDAGMGYLAYQSGPLYGLMDSTGRVLSKPLHHWIQVNHHQWVTYKENDLTGLADTSDRVITRDQFTGVASFGKDYCIVEIAEAKGAVNRQGVEIIPVKYDQCTATNDSTLMVRDGNVLKWYNLQGRVRKGMDFDSIGEFSANRVVPAKYRGRWGLLNLEGDWLMPPQFEEVRAYLQAAKGRIGTDWTFAYFDEKGHPSKVKRIVIIKDQDDKQEVDLFSVAGSNTLGWFQSQGRGLWGLRGIGTSRVAIEPRYKAIEVVPGTNYTLVKGKIKKDSEDEAWGLVNHVTGKVVIEPLFDQIHAMDWRNHPSARAIYAGSGKYALVSLKGETVTFDNAAYIGPFCDSIARINLGGNLTWSTKVGIDTIVSDRSRDRYSNEIKLNYQYCEGGKWGYIDANGKWLKPVEYECALNFDGSLARVKTKGKWGAIDKSFKVVVEPKFDFIERLFTVNGRTVFAVGKDFNAYGFIDEKGEISIKPAFAEVGQYNEGLVKVREGQKWGYADRKGAIVIPPQYGAVGDFHEGRARVRDNRAWGFIDTLGNTITPQKYLRAGDFKEGLAWVQTEKFFGYIDLNGSMVIDPAYSAVGDFSEGLAPARRKGVYGLINRKGDWVVAPHYYRIGSFKDSIAVIQEKGRFGLITATGDFLVKPIYKEIADFSEGLVRFKSEMQYGFMDPGGIVKIDDQFANAGDFSCGRAAIFEQGKWGFIDTSGQTLIRPAYPKVNAFVEDRAAVKLGNKWGFIDRNGNVVVPIVYDKVTDFRDQRAAVFISGLGWGFVDPLGTRVIPCEYDGVGFRQGGVISVEKNAKWGLINAFGATMTPCKYDAIGNFRQGLASVLLKRSIGVVDDRGKMLLDPQYDTVRQVGELIQVEDDDAIGYIDLDGNWVWQLSK